MSTKRSDDGMQDALARVDASRRGFLAKLLAGTAFAAPAIASLSLPGSAFAGQGTTAPSGGTSPVPTTPVPTTFHTTFITTPPHPSSPPPSSGSTTLYPTADTFIRKASQNTNEGANPRLYVAVQPRVRSLVQFDRLALASLIGSNTIASAQLALTIATNHDTWGETDDYGVAAHALKVDFVEGNGVQALMPPGQTHRGTGEGATWASPADPNTYDNKAPKAPRWQGGDFVREESSFVAHVNQMTGPVVFDVTDDVRDGRYGWLLKIEREDDGGSGDLDDDDDSGRRRQLGFERFRGAVEYYSRDGAGLDQSLSPQLVITFG